MVRSSLSLALASLLTACSSIGLGGRAYQPNPDSNHTHADFAVWVEEMKIDFSDAKYMSGGSSEEEGDVHEHEHRHPFLHLHDGIGHVVHRHKPGLTIGEFFASLGFRMTENCLELDTKVDICPDRGLRWRMFVNGAEQPFDAAYVFADMDAILLTYQTDDAASAQRIEEQLAEMTDDACRYSRTCPWKGEPPKENCIADPEVPCVVSPEDL